MKGELEINGYDAYDSWGISLEDGSLSELMNFPPMKEWITNESRLEDGKRYAGTPFLAERPLTLVLHMIAKTKTEFLHNHTNFVSEVLSTGVLNIRTKWQITTMYKCKYISCTQFSQYHDENGGIAKFSLHLVEPNPVYSNRLVPTSPISGTPTRS